MTKIMDQWQQSFGLSLLANCASTCTVQVSAANGLEAARQEAGTLLTAIMQDKLSKYLEKFINPHSTPETWSVVWGPQVVTVVPKGEPVAGCYSFTPTNSMFVATNGSRDVVAIAATNGNSKFDWLVEDFMISPGIQWSTAMALWKLLAEPNQSCTFNQVNEKLAALKEGNPVAPDPTAPTITFGGVVGISLLLGAMKDATQGGLIQFLNQRQLPITVAGHSLGGALAPQVALALIDPKQALLTTARDVTVYATAGASPGNAAFAQYYLQQLPVLTAAERWQIWNGVLANRFDLVPAAFTESTVLEWAKAMVLSGEFEFDAQKYFWQDAKDLAEVAAATAVVIGLGKVFAQKYGLLAHLGPGLQSVPLNPDAEPFLDFYWQFGNLTQTLRQTPPSEWPQRVPLTLGEQFDKQHVMAYEQIIFDGLGFSGFTTDCNCEDCTQDS